MERLAEWLGWSDPPPPAGTPPERRSTLGSDDMGDRSLMSSKPEVNPLLGGVPDRAGWVRNSRK